MRWEKAAFFVVNFGMLGGMLFTAATAKDGRGGMFFDARDWIADFLKVVLSYPGPIPASSVFPAAIVRSTQFNEYHGVISHFHMPPFSTVITLAARQMMGFFDPILLYALLATTFTAALIALVWRNARRDQRLYLLPLAVMNYPFIFLIDRGNLYAGLTCLCVIAAFCRQRLDWTTILLLALAINIRPNSVILAVLLLFNDRDWLKHGAQLTVVSVTVLIGSLAVAHSVYPEYTIPNVLHGLSLYNKLYVLGSHGEDFGSSAWGAARHMLPETSANALLVSFLGLLPVCAAFLLNERLSLAATAFIGLTSYTLASAVFGDYHLLVFVAPLLLLKREDAAFWPVLIGCCWVLLPKHFNSPDDVSLQTYLNPGGLFVAAAVVFVSVWSGRPGSSNRKRVSFSDAPASDV